MATRTAPTVDGIPTYKRLSITLYDYTGDQRTDSYQIDADATNVEIEAIVAAIQAITNGTIWRVAVSEVYNSVGDPTNADEVVWEESSSNLVFLAKNVANDAQDWYIPAPNNAVFVEGTENLDPTNIAVGGFLTAVLAVKAGFSFVSARFTSRRDIGSKINF